MITALTAVVIMGRGNVIGDGADQPWHIPEDQQRFKKITTGGTLIMGRRTFQAIGRTLPGRTTIVLTRDPTWTHPDVITASGPAQALEYAVAGGQCETFVAGGGEIYRLFWDRLTRLEVTRVDAAAPGSVTFPMIDTEQWSQRASQERTGFRFETWLRR